MTIDEAINKFIQNEKEFHELYGLCSLEYECDGLSDCYALANGKDKGCLKCAKEEHQIIEWLKELKTLREYITKELEVCCTTTYDIFDENDERYYVLTKLNNMITFKDRFPNNKGEK